MITPDIFSRAFSETHPLLLTIPTEMPTPHPRPCSSTAADLTLLYRITSSVLNRLPLYRRLRSYSRRGAAAEKDATLAPPPDYYDAAPTPDEPADRSHTRFLGLLRALGDCRWLPHDTPPEPTTTVAVAIHDYDHQCTCFPCFQHQHLYHLWQQQQQQRTAPSPPPPEKPLLHRLAACLVFHIFAAAFLLYPYAKAAYTCARSWARRNRVRERVGAAWDVVRRSERVRRVGGQVVRGVVEGVGLGVGVWGGWEGEGGL